MSPEPEHAQDRSCAVLMPHPERVFRNILMSWTSSDHSPWMQMFHNARAWAGK